MASYRLVTDGESWPLSPGENLLGRYSHCQVVLEAEDVAGEHARVDVAERPANGRRAGEDLTLTDLGTPGGTFLDGVRVVPEHEGGTVPLRAGQAIRVGSVTLRVEKVPDRRRVLASLTSRRPVRTALKVASGLLVAFILLLVVLRLVYSAERLRRDIAEALESALGRDTEIASIDYGSFSGRTELRGLVVHELPEFGTEPLLQVAGVVIRFRRGGFYSVFGGKLRADIDLHQPVLFIQRDERGRWNAADLVRAFARSVWAGGKGFRRRLPFSVLEVHLRARDATVRIRDDLTGRSEEITGVTFEAHLPALSEPLTYRLEMGLPVADRPGRISAVGEFRLFAGKDISAESVHGEVLHLSVEGLDLRAVPGLPALARGLAGTRSTVLAQGWGALDLDCRLKAAGLRSVKLEAGGHLAGGEGTPDRVTFAAELAGDLLGATLTAGEITLRGADWEFAAQSRVVPGEAGAGVAVLDIVDLDATLRAPLGTVVRLCGFRAEDERALSGDVELRLSTTGSTEALAVRAEASVSGLYSPATYAPPEDVSASFRGTVGLAGRPVHSGTGKSAVVIDSVEVKSFSAEASFLHAALAPGGVGRLSEHAGAWARLGPLEFDLDLDELVRRYGPALPWTFPRTSLHGLAAAQGEKGRIQIRHAVETRGGPRLEGVVTLALGGGGIDSIELDEKLGGEGGIAATLSGTVGLGGEEPELNVALTSCGELSRVLELVRPYLGEIGSVWARGRFNLADARLEGTPTRFSTRGRVELLGPELWGGLPTALPFSEPRIDAIWNVECDRTGGPVRLKVNVLKASSSTLRFKLEGEAEDLRRWLGRCNVSAFVDFDQVGIVLKKLDLLPPVADLRGSMNIDLGADTRTGRLELRSFSVDTPFLEARGGGRVLHVPVAVLGRLFGGAAPARVSLERAAEEMEGSIRVGATLDVEGVEALVRALAREPAGAARSVGTPPPGGQALVLPARGGRPDDAAPRDPVLERRGDVKLDLQAEGSGGELLVRGEIDLDRFAGRLGPYLCKSPDELASLRFSASVAAGRPDLFTLHSGVLTLGGRETPARLEFRGGLASALDRFEVTVRSERFPIEPLAALVPELGGGASGGAALNLRARGRLRGARLAPGSLELDGRVDLHDAEIAWKEMKGLRGRFAGSVHFSGRGIRADGLRLLLRTGAAGSAAESVRFGDARLFRDAGVVEFERLRFTRDAGPGVPSGTFEAGAKDLDLGQVLAAVSGRPAAAGKVRPRTTGSDVMRTVVSLAGFRVDGGVAAERVRLWTGGPDLTGLKAVASIGRGRTEVMEIECGILGGRAGGRITFDYADGRLSSRGEVSAEDMDLGRIAVSAGMPGALSGKSRATVRWTGEGFTREDLERSWEIELEGAAPEVSVDPGLWPIAREVRDAVELLLGVDSPPGGVKSRPVTVRVGMRRGRASMKATELELDTGLRLALTGRAELDGRIAGWVQVDGLPRGIEGGSLPAGQQAVLSRLVERGLLRFGVTGTWARPSADVRWLLWMLLDVPDEGGLEEEGLEEGPEGEPEGEVQGEPEEGLEGEPEE